MNEIRSIFSVLATLLSGVALYILLQQVGVIRPLQMADVYIDSVAADSWLGSGKPKK